MSRFFSVIVPCHNSSKYIERLLDSIVAQEEDIEVILVDDNSTDNWQTIAKQYKKVLDLHIYDRGNDDVYKVHCPGNTRREGLKYATGEWVTFIDHDDCFEMNAFKKVRETITEKDETRMVYTRVETIFDELDTYDYDLEELSHRLVWLHGKWYNRQYLLENNINFKIDLFGNEDLYFNIAVMACIARDCGYEYHVEDYTTYKWYSNPDSISHVQDSTGELYIIKYMDDFVIGALEPWLEVYEDSLEKGIEIDKKVFYSRFAGSIVSFYYYLGYMYWLYGDDEIVWQFIPTIKKYYKKILELFGTNSIEFVNNLYYGAPKSISDIRTSVSAAVGDFVDPFTLETFIIDYLERDN